MKSPIEYQNTHALEKVTPKQFSFSELSSLYNTKEETLAERLAPFAGKLGQPSQGYYHPNQVAMIFERLGNPYVLKLINNPRQSKVVILPEILKLLVRSSWNFARANLWGGQKFSRHEIRLIKASIREYYEQNQAGKSTQLIAEKFDEFLERILLVRNNAQEKNLKLAHPLTWFNPSFSKGFNQSAALHRKTLRLREKNPKFHLDSKQTAMLYREHVFNPSEDTFHKAAKAFSYRDSNLLVLFCNSVSHPLEG